MEDDSIKWGLAFVVVGIGTGIGVFFQVSM
jgi:hypothetical protein